MESQHRSVGFQPPLTARNGRILKVLAVCRISGPHQDKLSLADQEASYRGCLTSNTDLPFDMEVIASQGSGECIDRKEYQRAIELVESNTFDLVITEDLGRICRRVHAHLFCEHCVDHETRLIALNDHVDTGIDGWELHSYFAVMRHETYNRDTAQRIRRTLRNRFANGGVVQFTIYGYEKPVGTKTDCELYKFPDAEPIYDEWFNMLEGGATYAEVADFLNEQGISPGPYCRTDKWTGPMVGRITNNPILKGVRVRNKKIARRINSTGRRRSVNAPAGERLERECTHLAFIEPTRYDRVIAMLRHRNAKYRRNNVNGQDPRRNVPKKRTRWPGQHLVCGICGRLFVYGGHGQKDHLMCIGAKNYQCWNAITVDGPLAAKKISDAVLHELTTLEDFDDTFAQMVREKSLQANEDRQHKASSLAVRFSQLERELANLMTFIREGGQSQTVQEEVSRLETEKFEVEFERSKLAALPNEIIDLPTVDQLRELARDEFANLVLDSQECARLMRNLIPEIVVYPYRLFDGGRIVMRTRFKLRLANLIQDRDIRNILEKQFERVVDVDLFRACQRDAFRRQIVTICAKVNLLTGKNATIAQAAAHVGITATAAQRAVALQRAMDERGLTDPYVRVFEPPDDLQKLRRHKHRRYSFEPLDRVEGA